MSADISTVETPIIPSSSSSLATPVSIANGGTGSATQNFVDLTTGQAVAGVKTFSSPPSMAGATITGAGALSFTGGSGTLLSTHSGAYGTYPVLLGGNANAIVLITSGTGSGETITLPCSVGFPFPATKTPSGTTQTIDWTIGSSQKIDAASTTGTLVLTFSNPADGGRYILKTLGKTGRIWTFPASVKWAAGSAPTVTAVDGAIDAFEFFYDAGDSTYIGKIIAQNVS